MTYGVVMCGADLDYSGVSRYDMVVVMYGAFRYGLNLSGDVGFGQVGYGVGRLRSCEVRTSDLLGCVGSVPVSRC